MNVLDEIRQFLGRLARFAETLQRRIGWFLLLGLTASCAFAWQFYSPESAVWWNLVKCGVVLLPMAVWGIVWALLSQLREAPKLAVNLSASENLSLTNLRSQLTERKLGLITLVSIVRELRDNEAFETVTDTLGSFTLLANPLFLVIAFIMLVILLLLILISPFLLLI